MRLKRCKTCGKDFQTDKEGAYMCPECALQSRRKSVYRERVCVDCGASFMGYPRSKRCPTCAAQAKRDQGGKRRKQGTIRPLGSVDICENCGAEYIVNSGRQRYCKQCAKTVVAQTIRRHKAAYNREHSAAQRIHKQEMRTENKVCVICGKAFGKRGVSVTCSEKCANRLKQIRQAKADIKRGKRKDPAKIPQAYKKAED